MIIACVQDLPRDYCLLCKEKLYINSPMNDQHCYKQRKIMINGAKHWVSEYNYYLNVFMMVISDNLTLTYKTWMKNIFVALNDQEITIPFIELDFSDLDTLQRKLLTLVNFS